ncbi:MULTISPECIES: methylated-DNA--[protein]-cysteine S-methyltransferase [unclassified Sinorhizobium]|uniref:methylated-DNA--[protein]-cysteine S-methyltransferase n=1 Tax=unclassified Sinorhizobium TaxID=2613772 RepID=UPI003524DAE7
MTQSKSLPLVLSVEAVETPLGRLLLAVDGDGALCAADFADHEDRLIRLLERRFASFVPILSQGRVPTEITQALAAYFTGDIGAIRSIGLRTGGTLFQQTMWSALRAIEPGKPMTYSALAASLGRPNAARAVGHANGTNPFNIIVPCHRLVGANGDLTGYSGGIERKRWLLDHEAKHAA